jgi:hypothetical protein
MQFLENKYTTWYYNIISRALARTLLNNEYTELHHIIPKSLGGNNLKENLVILTAKEHFVCHILLTKMTTSSFKSKMIHAAIGMKRSRKYQHRYINSRLYEQVKKEFAILSRERNKGKILSAETRLKISAAHKGKIISNDTKIKMSQAAKGKSKTPMSAELKKQISDKLKGRPSHKKGKKFGPQHTLESKAKIAESNRTRVYSQETKNKISAGVKAANERKKLV